MVTKSVADSIVNKRRKQVEYLVLWEGYEIEEAVWEPWECYKHTGIDPLLSFHKWYPKKTRDTQVSLL